MRKRNNPVQIYLDDAELKRLDEWSAAANMSRSNYIRQLIAGFQPVEFPPAEYKQVIDELQHIGINMNQLAKSAFSCARFCKMMDTLTPRERITESILSKSSGRLTLANSSIRK